MCLPGRQTEEPSSAQTVCRFSEHLNKRLGCAEPLVPGVVAATRGTVAEATRISGAPPDRVQPHVPGHARPTGFCGVDEVALGPAPLHQRRF